MDMTTEEHHETCSPSVRRGHDRADRRIAGLRRLCSFRSWRSGLRRPDDVRDADERVLAAVGSDTWFDWSTDFCSAPLVGNTGRSFNFTNACRRHDFGYRNLQLLDRRYGGGHWNSANRRRVDQQFLLDMKQHCWSRPWYDEPTCLAWAETFYTAVRVAGGLT